MQSEGSACKWPMKRMMHMICGLEIHNKCIHGTEERTYFPHLHSLLHASSDVDSDH